MVISEREKAPAMSSFHMLSLSFSSFPLVLFLFLVMGPSLFPYIIFSPYTLPLSAPAS